MSHSLQKYRTLQAIVVDWLSVLYGHHLVCSPVGGSEVVFLGGGLAAVARLSMSDTINSLMTLAFSLL